MVELDSREIAIVKHKLDRENNLKIFYILLLSPVIFLLGPFIPGKRGKGALVEKMDYWDTVVVFALVWILILFGVIIYLWIKRDKEFMTMRPYLRKEAYSLKVKRKSRSAFSLYDDLLVPFDTNNVKRLKINRQESELIKVNDTLDVKIEVNTGLVLSLKKK
ncbi:hypothetical protein GGR28_003439 [Lewinella aquimaris]|uniref:Uncharacterized protein n=1 Tax=Neolewinella aquimaris TaxID=1835722 RepID=A0A840E590_9BACT|nr:hypothetical protein [Neolewinella aquimaris]MBB4080804.1 hypothetical protein [Neolewinella aquimaris]